MKYKTLILILAMFVLICNAALAYTREPPNEVVHQHITNESQNIWKLIPTEIKEHLNNSIIDQLDFPIVAGYEPGDDVITGSGEEDLVASTLVALFGNHFWQPDNPDNGNLSLLNQSVNLTFVDIVNESLTNILTINETNISKKKLMDRIPLTLLNKIQKDLWNTTNETKSKVIIQLKSDAKSKLETKIKRGKPKFSHDDRLLFADAYGDELEAIVNDSDVIKIWPDLETQVFLKNSVYQIKADYLWNLSLNGSSVKIAILDTGVDSNHEMLNGRVILQQDFTDDNSYEDVYGHGTHVAGIAAGNGQYKGVAYDAYILSGKVLDNSGSGQLSWLINGIDWAIQNNVDIISLSLGAIYSGTPEEQLNSPEVLKVQQAVDNGITVVIASGNCGSGNCGSFSGVTSPGIAENAITVGAVDDNSNWATFSSGGQISDYIKPNLVAPGVRICSSVPNGYDCKSGTSMATPHVSGAVALLLQNNNSLPPSQIKEVLESNALDLGESGKDTKYGSGLLNLENILKKISNKTISNETGISEEKDYFLSIPPFVVGKKDRIVLKYFNKNNCTEKSPQNQCKPKKISVKFSIEELDETTEENITQAVPAGKSKIFDIEWQPNLPGKHVLLIEVREEDILIEKILKEVNAYPKTVVNSIHDVRLMFR